MVLVLVEHDRGELVEVAREALTAGRKLAEELSTECTAVLIGSDVEDLADEAWAYGPDAVVAALNDALTDFGPHAWAAALEQVIDEVDPQAVVAVGSDRGNEVLAMLAARRGLPFVANCLSVDVANWSATRVQWGGSLLEDVVLKSELPVLTFAPHAVVAETVSGDVGDVEELDVDIADADLVTLVKDRVVLTQGVTLPTAPVVVGGGRGVGSKEGFAPLEDLAALLGGVVGCSRAVTNNGWRPHSDQVGQTGTRIAPELYIASGISGAIQHWVGAMASKKILAINTDPDANMVSRADYAVIGDLHAVIPAVTAEIQRRHG